MAPRFRRSIGFASDRTAILEFSHARRPRFTDPDGTERKEAGGRHWRCASPAAATARWCSTSASCGACTKPAARRIKRISSVSGGSITAGVLGAEMAQAQLRPGAARRTISCPRSSSRCAALASETIDAEVRHPRASCCPARISDRVAAAYDEHLFEGATLQDLPDEPRFVINATNVQSGVLWRFMKPYMRDYRVGEVKKPTCRSRRRSPHPRRFRRCCRRSRLRLDPNTFTPNSGHDLQRKPFTSSVFLTDGGVYDNLGLETAWKRYQTVLVSDGGGKTQAEEEPKSDWARMPIACST